ncbi:MAG: decarboxylating 6-phosphogluconate dehydrogenase [Candidatus Omnitrophica bacterium]|nr:decarboxylating 6-phosphogluconate dehydrogenase [Candidatus Omnitrophota bacterium]
MTIGFIGLGRMGLNMVERLLARGHAIAAYARSEDSRRPARDKGARTVEALGQLVDTLNTPRVVWVMVPAGEATEQNVRELAGRLSPGDIVVDGGNSNYQDSLRRGKMLAEKGIEFLDCGTSGGIWGLQNGYCLMIGGSSSAFQKVEPIFAALAPAQGYALVGPSGAGHFVKMIHNGIEYGMLQAYAEGFEILAARAEYHLDLVKIAGLWNQGSVVRSWLLELAQTAFAKDPRLEKIKGYIADSGEGRWTVAEAVAQNVPAPVLTLALLERLRSRQEDSFAAKMIAALRDEFGGHGVKKS